MTDYKSSLTVDFGQVGYRDGQPFCVRLDAMPLHKLIADAANAHRVYELLLIKRPGDVWDYVTVAIEQMPKSLAARIKAAHQQPVPNPNAPHPPGQVELPFNVFDRLFYWAGDDTEPEDRKWLNHRSAPAMLVFAQQLLAAVQAACAALDWNDHLLRHIVAQVRLSTHAFDQLDRRTAVLRSREMPPRLPGHTAGFYKELAHLVRDGAVCSVAYRASGDHRVLRTLATEQRRRANQTGHSVGAALQISALVNQKVSNEAWGSKIRFFEEGMAHGDLFIEGGGISGDSVRSLVAMGLRVPGCAILSVRDEGDIPGFERTAGDGWFAYRSKNPYSRRLGLAYLDMSPNGPGEAILSFGSSGAAVFSHEKALVMVGDTVLPSTRAALAGVLLDWRNNGGAPKVLVFAQTVPHELAGFNCVLYPSDFPATGSAAADEWLRGTLQDLAPWLDVVVALDSPFWANRVIAQKAKDQNHCWQPWTVASADLPALTADLSLEVNAAQQLIDANRMAQAQRPRQL